MQDQDSAASAALHGSFQQHLHVVDNHTVVGSDVRVTDPRGCCALCRNDRQLRLSHVVPRWAFQWMKKEGGVLLGVTDVYGAKYRVQDGTKHYLLCNECEQHLGQAEQYLSFLARGTRDDLRRAKVEMLPGPTLVGVDNTLVMRGILGILYKLHYAKSTRVALDAKLVSRLRDRVMNDDYPLHSLHLVAIKWLSCKSPKINPRAMVTSELTRSPQFLDLMMGGWSWTVVITPPGRLFKRGGVAENLLRPDHPWSILVADILHHRYYESTDYFSRAEKEPWLDDPTQGKTWVGFDPAEPCPCGLGELPFGECCLGIWV